MKKKLFALFLALVIALAVAGCGGSSENASASSAADTAAAAVTDAPTEVPTEAPVTEAPKAEAALEITDSGITTEVNSIGTTWYEAWYVVENTGDVPLFLETIDVDIETASGQMVKKISMMSAYPQVLLPGEVGAYYESSTLDDSTETDGLQLHGRINPVEAKVDCIRYTVENVEVKADTYSGAKVVGRVVNDTDTDTEEMIYVAALCYDADGAFLGAMFTILTDAIPANDYSGFEMQPFGTEIAAEDIADTVVYAYPYQFQF